MPIKTIDSIIDFIDNFLRQTLTSPGQVMDMAFKHCRNFSQELSELADKPLSADEVTPIGEVLAEQPEQEAAIPDAEQFEQSFKVEEEDDVLLRKDPLSLLRSHTNRKAILLQTLILREVLERPISLTNEDLDTHPRYRYLHDIDTELL